MRHARGQRCCSVAGLSRLRYFWFSTRFPPLSCRGAPAAARCGPRRHGPRLARRVCARVNCYFRRRVPAGRVSAHVGPPPPPPWTVPLNWQTGCPAPAKSPQLADLEAMIRYAPCGIAPSMHAQPHRLTCLGSCSPARSSAAGWAAHGRVELRRCAALSARSGAVALLRRGRAPLQKRCRVGVAATSGGGDSDPNNEPPTTTPPSPESDAEVRLRLCEPARARRLST